MGMMASEPPAHPRIDGPCDPQEDSGDLIETESAHSDGIQLQRELDESIGRDEIERSEARAETERLWYLEHADVIAERETLSMDERLDRLAANIQMATDTIASLTEAVGATNAQLRQSDRVRRQQFPIISNLLRTALDGQESNLLRADLDQVKINVAISICADARLRQSVCKFDVQVPVQDCLTYLGYQQAIAAAADDVENRAQSTQDDNGENDIQATTGRSMDDYPSYFDQLRDARSLWSDDGLLIPHLLCLDFSRSAIVPSFVGFSPSIPTAEAHYSMWLARCVLFGTKLAYRSEIFFRCSRDEVAGI